MKPKIFFFTLFLFLQSISLFSQCISIELSLTWEMGHDIFEEDSIVYIPKLHVTYRNNCSTNFYFVKMSANMNGLPFIPCGMYPHPDNVDFLSWSTNYSERVKKVRHYTNNNYNVEIGYGSLLSDCWHIYNDTTDITKDHYMEYINCDLRNIYGYISCDILNNDRFSYGFPLRDFKPSDLTAEHILDSIKDLFVFLKPGETFIDTYNLVAFKIVEGCFTFFIDQDAIMSYVLISDPKPDMEGPFHIEYELPTIVGEYHRYSGAFNTNKVTVCFGER